MNSAQKIRNKIVSIFIWDKSINIRSGYGFAVANAYENWYDLDDDEVISIIQDFKESIN